jgi:hypothetical protein
MHVNYFELVPVHPFLWCMKPVRVDTKIRTAIFAADLGLHRRFVLSLKLAALPLYFWSLFQGWGIMVFTYAVYVLIEGWHVPVIAPYVTMVVYVFLFGVMQPIACIHYINTNFLCLSINAIK